MWIKKTYSRGKIEIVWEIKIFLVYALEYKNVIFNILKGLNLEFSWVAQQMFSTFNSKYLVYSNVF